MRDDITVRRLTSGEAFDYLDALAALHHDCVAGSNSASVFDSLEDIQAVNFWRNVLEAVCRTERILLIGVDGSGAVLGAIDLKMDQPKRLAHRAEIVTMVTNRKAWAGGMGEMLLKNVERIAEEEGKTLLVLDTVSGSEAERLYRRKGWQDVGITPKYSLRQAGEICATTMLFKHLESARPCEV